MQSYRINAEAVNQMGQKLKWCLCWTSDTMGDFTFWLDLSQADLTQVKSLHFGLSTYWSTYLSQLFGLSRYLSRYLDRTFTQRIGSAKVKSKSEVAQSVLKRGLSKSPHFWFCIQHRIIIFWQLAIAETSQQKSQSTLHISKSPAGQDQCQIDATSLEEWMKLVSKQFIKCMADR